MPKTSHSSITSAAYSGLSHDLLVATLDAVSDAIIVICDQEKVQFFNSGAERLFGYQSAEIVGGSVTALIPKLNTIEHLGPLKSDQALASTSTFGKGQVLAGKGSNGEPLHLHVSLGEFVGSGSPSYVVLVRDLRADFPAHAARIEGSENEGERHDSRRLLRELHGVFQSVVLEELASNVADVVNQPLATMATYADASRRMLQSDTYDVETLDANLEKISSQAIRAGDAISMIRNRVPSSMFASDVVRVKDLLLELTDIIETEVQDAGMTLMLNIEEGLPAIRANAVHIQHVILLLLRNSLESHLSVASGIDDILISARKTTSNMIEIAVTDHGSGVESEDFGTTHYPFTSEKSENAGLGLSVCHTIIDKHRGRLWHELNPAGVSRFLFTLPAVDD